MLSRLVRVLPRPFAPSVVAMAGLRASLLARTFLTTAYLSEPAAKTGQTVTKKAAARKTASKKTATKKADTKKATKAKAKPKAKADPNARFKNGLKAVKVKKAEMPPLKPVSPYGLFLREQYAAVGPLGDRAAFTEKSKAFALRWRSMSEEEKKPFYDKGAEEIQRYYKAREEWFSNSDPRILRALNMQRKAQNKPAIHRPAGLGRKRPLTSYMLFVRDVKDTVEVPSGPNVSPKEVITGRSRKIGEMWQALPAEEKERYASQYAKALAEWKESMNA